jgi:hypothetical protein
MSKAPKSTTKVEGEAPDLPTSDQEFIFKDIQSAPAWVDRGWAGYDRGPALQLPVDLSGKAPYTTKVARVGDTVRFVAAKGARPAHFEVIEGDQTVEDGTATIKPAQASNVSLEDALKTGAITADELGSDAKAQVSGRSPELRDQVETGKGGPKPQDPPVKAK